MLIYPITMATTHIASRYPEFVLDHLMDMVVGPVSYHKNNFRLVLQELLIKLIPRIQYQQKSNDLESVLKQFGSDVLLAITPIRYDIGHDLVWPDQAPIPTVFDTEYCTIEYHLTWNTNVFYGPPSIMIGNFHLDNQWVYAVANFFAPNMLTDADLRTYTTLSELIIDMVAQNNLHQSTD